MLPVDVEPAGLNSGLFVCTPEVKSAIAEPKAVDAAYLVVVLWTLDIHCQWGPEVEPNLAAYVCQNK